jgi:actin-related protein
MRKITLAVTLIIVIALIGTLYLYADRIENELHLTKPALKITVTTGINASLDEDLIQITNMTFEQTTVPAYYRSVDSPVVFPDINIEGNNILPISKKREDGRKLHFHIDIQGTIRSEKR